MGFISIDLILSQFNLILYLFRWRAQTDIKESVMSDVLLSLSDAAFVLGLSEEEIRAEVADYQEWFRLSLSGIKTKNKIA